MPDLNDLTNEAANSPATPSTWPSAWGSSGSRRPRCSASSSGDRVAGDRSLEDLLAETRAALHAGVRQLDEIVETAISCVESTFQPLEEQLPSPAQEVAGRAHDQARELRGQVRELIVSQI